jgi:hypothetical protein
MTDMTNIEWRFIPGTEERYSVSSTGLIRAEAKIVWSVGRKGTRFSYEMPQKLMKLSNDGNGYPRCNTRVNGQSVMIWSHIAVALAFIGPRPEGHDVRHLDGNPRNNHVSNIAYGTRAENIQDAKRHGTFRTGRKTKIDGPTARKIAQMRDRTGWDIAEEFGISEVQVHAIRGGKSWQEWTRDVLDGTPFHKSKKNIPRGQKSRRLPTSQG